MEITSCLENNFVPSKKEIHDCVDTGTTMNLIAETPILFPCDCLGRDYKSGDALFNKVTSSFTDHIDNGIAFYKIKMTLKGQKDAILFVRIYVQHPTLGNIEFDQFDMVLHKTNIDCNLRESSFVYMGIDSEAKTYGFVVEITPSANMELKARSILVAA